MQNQGVTWRSLLIGSLLIPPNAYWVIQLELVWDGTFPSVITLLFNVVFSLFVVIAINLLVQKFHPKSALSYGEILTIYIIMAVGISLCGCDVVQALVHIIVTPSWYATSENEWTELFHSYLPKYFVITDKDIFTDFYQGESSFWRTEYVKAWATPIAVWTAFILVFIFTMACINTLLRKQWVERERLTYPIIRLPQEMARSTITKGIFRNKMMWIGFTVAGGITLINGLSFLYPVIPYIPVKHQWLFNFTDKPWNAVGWMPISFYPFVLGIGFLMPLDLAFSCWFFYLIWKAELVIGSAAGVSIQGYPFAPEQATGVWMGIFAFTIWISRHHLKHILVVAFKNGSKNEEEDKEPMPYRMALIGMLVGLCLLVAICTRMGMSIWMGIAYFLVYFALGVTITRIRAELGPPVHDLYGVGPDFVIVRILGTRRIGDRNLMAMTLLYWLNRESYRSFPMAHQMEGMKLAEGSGINPRRLVFAFMLAGLVGTISCFWAVLQFGYDQGADIRFGGPARWFATEGFSRLGSWLTYPQNTDFKGLGFTAFGFIISLVLLILRMNFIWFPLHPIGYAISYWWAINLLWFPILLSFITKTIILKYGGLSMYRQTIPLFLGFILGEYFIGGLWNILGIAIGRRMYAFWI